MSTEPKIFQAAQEIALGEEVSVELTEEEIFEAIELSRLIYCQSCS